MEEKLALSDLEKKVHKLLDLFQKMKDDNFLLREELEKVKQILKDEQRLRMEYKEEYDRMKIVNAMLGSTEHRRLMKIKMNKIIREVDTCIVGLKNQ